MIFDVNLQLTFLADLLIKSAIVLVVGFSVAGLARRSAAAVRHCIWSLAFLSLLILPVLSMGFPHVRFDILPGEIIQWLPRFAQPLVLDGGASLPNEQPGDRLITDSVRGDRNDLRAQPVAEFHPTLSNEFGQELPPVPFNAARIDQEDPIPANVPSWPFLVWGLGLAVVIFPVLIGLLQNTLRAARCERITDSEALGILDSTKRAIGIRNQVRLSKSETVSMPMTWGIVFPIIILPKDWNRMSAEAVRFTLLHELAHIKRWDVAQQLLARLATSIYWFNPACWVALRKMRFEREMACDDCVLRVEPRAVDYAAELVNIARSYCPAANPAGVTIVQSSELRSRIESMLDSERNHNPLDAQIAKCMAIAAFVLVVLLASTKIGAHALADNPGGNQHESKPADPELKYAAIVTDSQGRAIANAKVYQLFWGGTLPDERMRRPIAITGADGRFDFSVRFTEELKNSTAVHAILYVTAPEHGLTNVSSISYETTGNLREYFENRGHQQAAERKKLSTITLPDDVPLRGRVLDIDGQPVANAKVSVSSILMPPEPNGDLDAWEAEAKTGKVNFYTLRNRLKLRSTLGGSDWLVGIAKHVTTNSEGYFEFPGIGADRIVDLQVTGPRIEASQLTARTRPGDALQFPSGIRKKTCYPNDFQFVAGPGGKLEGRVTDFETGDPITGMRVAAGNQSTRFGIGKPWLFTETDEDGRYELDGFSLGKSQLINVAVNNSMGYLPAGGHVEIQSGSRTLTKDFKLHKGHLLRGRVIHKNTGKPLTGFAHYYVARNNPELKRLGDFAYSMIDLEAITNSEGEFEFVVPQGMGLLGFVPGLDTNSFPRGMEADAIDIDHTEDRGVKIFHTRPRPAISSNECLLRQVDVRDGTPTEIELSLESGQSITCRIADTQGNPVKGCSVLRGQIGHGFYEQIEGAEFQVAGVLADTEHHLFAFHRELGLGGTATLKGVDDSPTIVMLPLGRIRGRLVDELGDPLSVYVNMSFGGVYAPGKNLTNDLGAPGQSGLVASDENGVFQIDGLLPNFKYEFTTAIKGIAQPVAIDIEVEPGETKDIGTVTPGKLGGDD